VYGYWEISRPNGDCKLTIEFEGLDDMVTLPIENAYGCRITGMPSITAYFSKLKRSWPKELEQFISKLNEIET